MPSEIGGRKVRLPLPLRFVASLLLLVQAVVVLTPLAEARGGVGAASHVDARSEQRHYSHAEANCAFCTARSIHAPDVAQLPTRALEVLVSTGLGLVLVRHYALDLALPHHSRAPPALS